MSILFIFSKNQFLILLIFTIVSFISFSFISAHIFMISFILLILRGFFLVLLFLVVLGVNLGCLFDVFPVTWGRIVFSLRIALAASHRFWAGVFSLSFVSRNFFISLLIFSVTCWLFRNVLFKSPCVCVSYSFFSLVIDI